MMKKPVEIYNKFPRWLEYSGLSAMVNKAYGQHTWAIFKKLIEFDWMWNQEHPDYFDMSHEELSEVLGLSRDTIRRCVTALAKGGLIEYYQGKHTRRKSRFRIKEPIPVMRTLDEISYKQGGNKGKKGCPANARYAHKRVADSNALSHSESEVVPRQRVATSNALSNSEAKLTASERVASSKKSVATSSERVASSHNKDIRKRFKREKPASFLLQKLDKVMESKRLRS